MGVVTRVIQENGVAPGAVKLGSMLSGQVLLQVADGVILLQEAFPVFLWIQLPEWTCEKS